MLKKEDIEKFHMPRWEELPEIDLYLDQVVSFIEKHLEDYLQSDNDDKDNKLITKTMVNNYVKQKVLEAPIKKKYSKNSLAYLFVICTLKSVYSIKDIDKLIKASTKDIPVKTAYNKFCDALEAAIFSTLIDKKLILNKNITENGYVLFNVVQAVASKIYVEKGYIEKQESTEQ